MSTKVVNNVTELKAFLNGNITFPEELCDGITYEPIYDPVTCSDGRVYDRNTFLQMIQRGFRGNDGNLLSNQAFPNVHFQNKFDTFLQSKGIMYRDLVRRLESGIPVEVTITEITKLPQASPIETITDGDLVISVADISGSMAGECVTSEGVYTRLELLKYANILMVLALKDGDSFAMITFSTYANVLINKIVITPSTRTQIIEIIKRIRCEGSTNIGAGLRLAFDIIRNSPGVNSSVHLFTDGENSPQTRSLEDTFRTISSGINTKDLHMYGFSSSADAKTLCNMSPESTFYFISDHTMLLTSFVNGYANSSVRTQYLLDHTEEPCRISAISLLSDLIKNSYGGSNKIRIFVDHLKTLPQTLFISNLILDFEETTDTSLGQVSKAIIEEYYSKWGIKFLYSYRSSLMNSYCVNYKDRAPSCFITAEKDEVIVRLEEIIANNNMDDYITKSQIYIPPPAVNSSLSANIRQPVSVGGSTYNAYGGCFSGESLIMTEKGEVPISNLKKTDIVYSYVNGDIIKTKVHKLIRIPYRGTMYCVNQKDNVLLTAYHPYMYYGKVSFPIDNHQYSKEYDGYVYDLILENRGLISDNSKTAYATWGHNCNLEKFDHPFFMGEEIVKQIEAISNDFLVHIDSLKRDNETQLVCGLVASNYEKRSYTVTIHENEIKSNSIFYNINLWSPLKREYFYDLKVTCKGVIVEYANSIFFSGSKLVILDSNNNEISYDVHHYPSNLSISLLGAITIGGLAFGTRYWMMRR